MLFSARNAIITVKAEKNNYVTYPNAPAVINTTQMRSTSIVNVNTTIQIIDNK